MNIALWIVAGVLAALYLVAGIMKAFRPKEQVATMLPWAADFSVGTVKFIGVVEILGAIGLIIPWLTGVAAILTPLAATGLAIVQILAIVVHVRRGELNVLGFNVILLLAALFVAIFRFAGV